MIGPAGLGANIIDPITSSPTKLDDHFGISVGFFHKRKNGHPIFIIFFPEDEEELDDEGESKWSQFSTKSTHIFVYYVESGFKTIQQTEMDVVKLFAPKLDLTACQFGVIDVRTETPKLCWLSVLFQALEMTANYDLVNHYMSSRHVMVRRGSSLLCFNQTLDDPRCNSACENWVSRVVSDLSEYVICVIESLADASNVKSNMDVLVAKYRGHYIYGVHVRSQKTVALLLPHLTQFRRAGDLESFTKVIESAIGKRKFIATRYLGDSADKCYGPDITKLILLMLEIRPNVLTIVRPIDVIGFDIVIGGEPQADISEVCEPIEDVPSPLPYQAELRETAEIDIDASIIPERSDSPKQFWDLTLEEKIEAYSRYIERRKVVHQRLKLGFPLVGLPGPNHDPYGRIMHDRGFFEVIAQDTIELFGFFSDTTLLPILDSSSLRNGVQLSDRGSRYYIQPYLDDEEESYSLVIMDAYHHEWIYMNPNNDVVRSEELFSGLHDSVNQTLQGFGTFKGRAVLMTSYFHQSWPKLHLLMGLYTVCSLLRLANRLPFKIIYQERDFRRLCWSYRVQQNFANQKYNLERNLLNSDGTLKPDAYVGPVFIVPVIHAVVPKDQCMFCKARGFRNLARHIIMKHTSTARDMINRRHQG